MRHSSRDLIIYTLELQHVWGIERLDNLSDPTNISLTHIKRPYPSAAQLITLFGTLPRLTKLFLSDFHIEVSKTQGVAQDVVKLPILANLKLNNIPATVITYILSHVESSSSSPLLSIGPSAWSGIHVA